MNKTKNAAKFLVFAIAVLLALALMLGITGAWYSTTRIATGTIKMRNGILVDYSGFGKVNDDVWASEEDNNITFRLFLNQSALPGAQINLNNSLVKANDNSTQFYARVKLAYKFFTDVEGTNDVTASIADQSFIVSPNFSSAWINSGKNDGWLYYATGSTFNIFPNDSYVSVFADGAKIVLDGNAEGFNHTGGGYKYSEQILIKKIEAHLVFEALQANDEAVSVFGWGIYVPPVVENESNQVVEILQNTITLGDVGGAYKLGTGEAGSLDYDAATLGNTLKIIVAGNSQINANAFANSELENIYIGDADYISGVSSYSAKIYSSPATFTIGSNAFAGCTNLKLYLSSSVNYTIYTNAVPSTATVYYNGSQISLPSSAGAVSNTTITMATPSIVTGGSGAGAVGSLSAYGEYTYEDASGNIWHFDLGKTNGSFFETSYYGYSGNDRFEADICYCDMANKSTSNQTITIPSSVSCSELVGNIPVVCVEGARKIFSNPTLITGLVFPNTLKFTRHYIWLSSSELPNLTEANVGSCDFDIANAFTDSQNLERFIVSGSNTTIYDGAVLIRNNVLMASAKGADITSIEIPNTVTSISNSAFGGCHSLTSITIPNSVTSIGKNAFSGCTGLTSITIPDSVTSINFSAFSGCTGLTSITIPSSVTSIGGYTFSGCTSLQSVTIPNSVTSIGDWAFADCYGLTSITIPNSVTVIDGAAFRRTGLTSVTIQGSVRDNAFYQCTSLTEVTIASSVTSINGSAFDGCTSLTRFISDNTKYTTSTDGRCLIENDENNHTLINFIRNGFTGAYAGIPANVTSIGYSAFKGCTSLTSITIPDSVTSIGNSAFTGCTGLTSITIPDSVTSIGEDAFQSCTGLSGSLTIPDSVTSIGNSAFAACNGLTSITIGSSVNFDSFWAFSHCAALQSVTFEGAGRTQDLVVMATSFHDCPNLILVEFVNWPAGVNVTIQDDAFAYCHPDLVVNIPSQS